MASIALGLLIGGGILQGQGYRSKAISAYFSPDGGTQAAILDEIRDALKSLGYARG